MKRPLLVAVAVLAGCGSPAVVTNLDMATTTMNDMTGASPDLTPVITGTAVVTSRDSMNVGGTINTIALADSKITKALDTTLDADHVIHVVGDKAYVLNRIHNNLRVYNTSNWTVTTEIALGGGFSYPQDALPVPNTTQVIITFAGNPAATAVGLVDTATPSMGVVKSISIPVATADPDGKPEPSSLYYCKGLFYTGLGDYDSMTTFAPTGPGRIAVLDPTATAATGVIQLAFQNPTGMYATGSDCATVFVSGSGPFGIEPDSMSGVERIDLAGKQSLGALTDGKKLAGTPGTIVITSPTRGVMVVFFDLQTVTGTTGGYKILARARLVAFNPTDGTLLGDASEKAGYISFLALAPTGDLWFGADNFRNVDTTGNLPGGLYVGRPDTRIGGTPIDVGQVPVAIDFKVP